MNDTVTEDTGQLLRRLSATAGTAWYVVLSPVEGQTGEYTVKECGVHLCGDGASQTKAKELLYSALQLATTPSQECPKPYNINITDLGDGHIDVSCATPELASQLAGALWDSGVSIEQGRKSARAAAEKSLPQEEKRLTR